MGLGQGRAVPLNSCHFLISLGQVGHEPRERFDRCWQRFQTVLGAPSPEAFPIPGIRFHRVGRAAQPGLDVARGVLGQLRQSRRGVTGNREFG